MIPSRGCPSYEEVLDHIREFRSCLRGKRKYGNLDEGQVAAHLDMCCRTCTANKERAHAELEKQETLLVRSSVEHG